MHLLVIMKTMSVTIDRQVLISLVSVLVSSIVSSVFGQRCHSHAWLIGRCLGWSLRSLAYARLAAPPRVNRCIGGIVSVVEQAEKKETRKRQPGISRDFTPHWKKQ